MIKSSKTPSNLKGRAGDSYNKLHYFLAKKPMDDSGSELFETFLKGILLPEFERSYGVKLKYNKDTEVMVKNLEALRDTLVATDYVIS